MTDEKSTANEVIPFDGTPRFPLLEEAQRALAAATTVDEVKNIRNESVAMRAYAKIAKDRTMEARAAAIRIRAMERLYEMMQAQAALIGLAKPPGGTKQYPARDRVFVKPDPDDIETGTNIPGTLAEAGIDKNLANEARKIGKLAKEGKLEEHITEVQEKIINPIRISARSKEDPAAGIPPSFKELEADKLSDRHRTLQAEVATYMDAVASLQKACITLDLLLQRCTYLYGGVKEEMLGAVTNSITTINNTHRLLQNMQAHTPLKGVQNG